MDTSDYTVSFVKRQEEYLVEYIRKTIDLDIRLFFANEKIKELTTQFEESQKQIQLQNEMMNQAAKSVEELTLKRDQLNKIIEENQHKISQYTTKINVLEEQVKVESNKSVNFEREYQRQKVELQQMFEENTELKNKITEPKKMINKPKKLPEISAEVSDVNIF
jgi:chromosome segregation ATPase